MSGRRILSDEQIDLMAEMRESGESYSAIADWFTRQGAPIHFKTIRWQCLRVGAFPEGRVKPANLGLKTAGSNGVPFSADEDRIILAMRERGARTGDIARRLDRKHNSITGRLMTLASWEAYEEMAA